MPLFGLADGAGVLRVSQGCGRAGDGHGGHISGLHSGPVLPMGPADAFGTCYGTWWCWGEDMVSVCVCLLVCVPIRLSLCLC